LCNYIQSIAAYRSVQETSILEHHISPRLLAASLIALVAAGCSYNAAVAPPPPAPIETSLEAPLPGPVGLIVDTGELDRHRRARPGPCNGHVFEVDASAAFRAAARASLRQVFDPIAPDEAGAPRTIRLTVEDVDYRGKIEVGLLETVFRGTAELSASLRIEGPDGKIYETSREATGRAEDVLALTCDNIPAILASAMAEAMQKLLADLSERAANAPKVRAAFTP